MANFDYGSCLRAEILSESLTRPIPEQARDKSKLWLDKNECIDPELNQYVASILQDVGAEAISTYPDCYKLYSLIAEQENIEIENILLTAGSDGAIRTVFESCIEPGDCVIHPDPTFAMYYVYCKMFGAQEVTFSYQPSNNGPKLGFQQLLESINENKPKLVCLANPDSPTGSVVTNEQMKELLDVTSRLNCLLLIDEAYYPFYSRSVINFIKDYPNLIVTRTFAKAWGVAGLRIGFLAASKKLCNYLHKVKPMYEVNTVAVRVMEKLLENEDVMRESASRILKGKRLFSDEMSTLGFDVVLTHANFIHVNFEEYKEAVFQTLQEKVLYRKDVGHPCLKGYSRFTVSVPEVMLQIVELIKEALRDVKYDK